VPTLGYRRTTSQRCPAFCFVVTSGTAMEENVSEQHIPLLVYQAFTLVDELESIGNPPDYPAQAQQARNAMLCVARCVSDILSTIEQARQSKGHLDHDERDRATNLGAAVHTLYGYMRYLRAASSTETPPGIQVALSQLAKAYFPDS